jgi:lysophospholipase L1-like esterase
VRSSARRRRPLATAALAFGTLLALFAAAEGVARLLWRERRPATRSIPAEWRGLPRIEGLFALARPNQRGLAGGALFETNSAGFRGPERSEHKPPGVFRIVVFGDSIAMGMGVVYADTYAARLERDLAAGRPGATVEVLDVALSGLNAHAAVGRLASLGLRYEPDLIVYGYTLNDVEGPDYRRSVDWSFIDPRAYDDSPLRLWRLLGPRFASLRELLLAPRGSYSFELDENYFRNEPALRGVHAALDRLAGIARERGICAVVLIHTRLYWLSRLHPYRRHYAAVGEAAEQRGLFTVESFPTHRGERATDLWINPLDPHPNARGHELLFEALRDGLAELPERCLGSPGESGSRS